MNERLEAIKKRLEAATPGPWFIERRETETGVRYQHITAAPEGIADTYHHEAIEIQGAAISGTSSPRHGRLEDAQFIAHSRTDLSWLVGVVEAQAKAIEAANELRTALVQLGKEHHREVAAYDDALAAYRKVRGGDA